ncbi:MAG TPA: FliM/FliN family flagellar motor switch protein [Hyphomicrobiaceae bacterium]
MSESDDPEIMRRLVVERLIGATDDPDRVIAAARKSAARAVPLVLEKLSEQLSFELDVELKSVELIRLADAIPAPDSGEAVAVAGSATSPDALTLQIDSRAISLFLDAYLGGDPNHPPIPIERELSAIELDVTHQVLEIFAQAINGHGARALGLRFPLAAPVAGEGLKRLAVRDGPGVRMVFSVASACGDGEVRALMPQRVLLQERSPTGNSTDETANQAQWRQRFNEELMRSAVAFEAKVPMPPMTLGDVAAFRVGQLIELPVNARSETRLSVRGRPVFICEFGKLGQNYTVRIKDRFDAGQEFIAGLAAG